jgi:hypothetical protein
MPASPDWEGNPTIGENQEKLIGRVIVEWSKLEAVMEDTIWCLLSLDMAIGRKITTRMDVGTKITMLRALGEGYLPTEVFHALSLMLDLIDMRREDRNAIAHGSWGRQNGIPIVISLRTKPNAPNEVVSETFPDTRMRAILADIQRSKTALIRLMDEIAALRNNSPTPHPEG